MFKMSLEKDIKNLNEDLLSLMESMLHNFDKISL
jgi:hypothetical protein